MHRRIFSLLAIVALLGVSVCLPPARARAQDQPELRTLKISLWPEFDRPGVLVIYQAMLSSGNSLPVNLVFRIPPGAQPHVAAVGPSPEQVGEVIFTNRVTGEWQEVTFPATFPAITFEYYDTSLAVDGQARQFEYQWPGDYAVDALSIEVQKPLGAGEINISPPIEETQEKADGLEYYSTEAGSLASGQAFRITLDYTKTTDTLTAAQLRAEPSGPISQNTAGRNRVQSMVVGVFVILGIALIAGGGWWYWQSGRKSSSPAPRKRGRTKHPAGSQVEAVAGGDIYCHQCGKRAGQGDRFCRSCGTRLRIE